MFRRSTTLAVVLAASVAAFALAEVARAERAETPQAREEQVARPVAGSEGGTRGLSEAGDGVEEARTRSDIAASRTRDLDRQARNLGRELEAQREGTATSRAGLEKRTRAAYKRGDLIGIGLMLGTLFGEEDAKSREAPRGVTARMLGSGRESVESHRDSQRALKDTLRQLAQKRQRYRESQEEQRARAEGSRRETQLEGVVGGFDSKKEQMEMRIKQLEAVDRAGMFDRPPASSSGGDGGAMREQELEIAQEDIVARPVEPIPYEGYVQIYKASAKRYGFAKDWYVLAAVGKVESNHGENMGPSSAGALGPMQFLPSTWKGYGVDGDGDGVANIMNPADALPAAAKYLRDGGAPNDWYKALYTYNHSGQYVREVLGVAEGYRRLAQEDEVEPYTE